MPNKHRKSLPRPTTLARSSEISFVNSVMDSNDYIECLVNYFRVSSLFWQAPRFLLPIPPLKMEPKFHATFVIWIDASTNFFFPFVTYTPNDFVVLTTSLHMPCSASMLPMFPTNHYLILWTAANFVMQNKCFETTAFQKLTGMKIWRFCSAWPTLSGERVGSSTQTWHSKWIGWNWLHNLMQPGASCMAGVFTIQSSLNWKEFGMYMPS